jgi:P4 family phage/plasmid primase-like protien
MSNKESIIKLAKDNNKIVYTIGYFKYFYCDTYTDLLSIIDNNQSICEYIYPDAHVPLFFDIDIKDIVINTETLLAELFEKLNGKLKCHSVKKIILTSHCDTKKSFHIIYRMFDENQNELLFENVSVLKKLHSELHLNKVFDSSVYKDGLFRTVNSSKPKENRPFILQTGDILDSFVMNHQDNYKIISESTIHDFIEEIVSESLVNDNKNHVLSFINTRYNIESSDIIKFVFKDNMFMIGLNSKFCNNLNREHTNNHQYIVLDKFSCKQKCHGCKDYKFNEIKSRDYPENIKDIFNIKDSIIINNNSDELINEHFTRNNNSGKVIDIKYKRDTIAGKIINNRQLRFDHFEHNESCKGDLFYNININRDVKNKIMTMINCKKCGFVHTETHCENNIVYQLILNNVNEDRNELKIIVKKENQLSVFDNEMLDKKLYCALSQEDDYICEILYELYKDTYLIIKNQWYHYNGIIWEILNDEIMPIDILNGIKIIKENIKELYILHESENNLPNEELKLLLKVTDNLSKKLSKNNEDISYVTASKKYFSRPGLVFNEKRHLWGFKNGVYDLEKMEFRKGIPEDYLSIQMNYDYYEKIDVAKRDFLLKFLQDILPIETVKDFLLYNISACLLGKENKEQEFYILTGKKGANGKSVLCTLIENTFGDFFASPEPTLLTKPRERANEANEALKDLMGKRIAITSEPNKRDRILSDNLKKFTGGDTLTVRGLHEKSQKMSMNSKMFMLCNGIPLLDDCQDAEIRRLCIINFPTRFCENPTRPNEKKIDITVSSKLRTCQNEFFNLLLEYLRKYLQITSTGNKINKPKEVTEELTKYIQRNKNDKDAYEFVDSFIEFKENTRTMCSEIYKRFEEWCLDEGKIKPLRKELDEIIENQFDISTKSKIRFPDKTNYGWYNIRFKENN